MPQEEPGLHAGAPDGTTPPPEAADAPEPLWVQLLDEAQSALDAGDRAGALARCKDTIAQGELPLVAGLQLGKVLERCGQQTAAKQIAEATRARAIAAAEEAPEDALRQAETGMLLSNLDYDDDALPFLERALTLNPAEHRPAMPYAVTMAQRRRTAEALPMLRGVVEASALPGEVALSLAKAMAHFEATEEAEALLALAAPYREHLGITFEYVEAALRGKPMTVEQNAMAIDVFDAFAESYDTVLTMIRNNGPKLMAQILDQVGLPKDGSRAILDAGCGTGLCAPFLRPYARVLQGVDISIPMLEIAKDKALYDYLARTDLGEIHTWPEGVFDLVVSSDVMCYFGALDGVLGNIYRRLAPGGWLVFTLEDAADKAPAAGFRLGPSGRHAHGADYVREQLSAAGFLPPRIFFQDVIRHEFQDPVLCHAVAVQKPAIAASGG